MKQSGRDFCINWSILHKSNTSKKRSGNCNLRIDEKLVILLARKSDTGRYFNKEMNCIFIYEIRK